MKVRLRCYFALVMMGFAVNAAADLSGVPSGSYGLDKTHGYITFSYSHLGFSNPQVGFDRFDVALNLDSAAPENSQISATIEASSINSRVLEFDQHLNGTEYFDTGNFPEIRFESTAVKPTGDQTFEVGGVLTIKGISKPVTLAATINKAAMHPMRRVPTVGVSATAAIKRSDWGLSKYAPAVGDDITLTIEVELPKSADE